MTTTMSMSSSLQALDNSSQPPSKASSPASPTASFQTQQQPRGQYVNVKPSVRGQNNIFPSTPTTAVDRNTLEPPSGMTYAEFVRTWSDAHVARWLSDIKCGNHAATFKENDIRGDVLLELDQVTLKEMGLASIGDRLRIVNAVKNLRQKCTTRSTPSPFEAVRREPSFSHNRNASSSSDIGEPSHRPRRLENGRPPPLHLNPNVRSGDLPRLVHEPDSARAIPPIRPLPQTTNSSQSVSTPNSSGTSTTSSRNGLPPLPPAPRSQAPLPPGSTGGRLPPNRLQPFNAQPQRSRTPTQADVPAYAHSPLPPAPAQTPTTGGSVNSNNWSGSIGGYGLPSDPRPGNLGGKSLGNANASRGGPSRSPNPNALHNRNMSFSGINSPLATTPTGKARPSTGNNSHPYASDTARQQALQAPTAQQLQQLALSPIAESFVSIQSSGGGTPSPPNAFSVGRGPFNRPMTPQHSAAPSLDDLRRKLVKFMLPEEGHSCTINAEDCVGGIQVLEKVLKKFNKLGSRGDSADVMDLVETENGGLSLDGWGVYLDWGQGETGKPLTEAELLSICQAPPGNPARERGLTLRRTGKGKRSKALHAFFGEPPLLGQRSTSPTSPAVHITNSDSDRRTPVEDIVNSLSPKYQTSFEDVQSKNTKRASSVSILSGLGVPHPEKALEPPASPSGSSGRRSPNQKRPSKLRNFFGQRPPSELITTHLAEYFPFTEKKVLERTARHSMMRASTIGSLGKRDSTMSWNPAPPLPSRFSSSTQGDRTSMSPIRTSFSSIPPPVPDKPPASPVSPFTGEMTPVTDEPPRMSLSTEDGQSIDLDSDATNDGPPRMNSTPELLPPVNLSSESFSESMENLTGNQQRSRPPSRTMSIASRRMSYMTELRSKRDVSDTASMMTVDEITASVESRRESIAIDRGTDSDWTKVDTDEVETVAESEEETKVDEDESEYEEEEDSEEGEMGSDDDDDEPGKSVTSGGNKWIKGALIGAGSFGKVYLGMDAADGLLMAVKQVELLTGSAPNEERKKSMLTALELEIDLLKDLQHENIVQYLYSSLDDDFLNIFLEYVPGGSVTALLRNYGAFEEPLVKNFVRQILQGLNYLHERNIIHRDIKGANILVDNKGGIKISDFGISKKVEDNLLGGKRMNRPSLQGSVFWMAPEVVKQTSHTKKADIWSVGCLVVEMLTGEHPWAQLTQMQAIFKIGSSAKPTIPSDISADAQDFLQKTFDLDHEARPGADQLLHHPWIAVKPKKGGKGHALKPPPTIEITA